MARSAALGSLLTIAQCTMYRADPHNAESQETIEAIEEELASLLAEYVQDHRTLSSWGCHCLAQAIDLLRGGLYAQALERVTQMLCPPVPLPAFPIPEPLTLHDVRCALDLVSHDALSKRRMLPGLSRLAREAQAGPPTRH
jgi:hypothetical protein